MTLQRRRWVLAPIAAVSFEDRDDQTTRPTTPADDRRLARLLDDAYLGTIDYDDAADHVAELETWRKIDGADDEASRLAIADGEVVGACLVGRELGAPFLYEIAVINKLRRHGLARALLDQALSALAVRGEPHIAAWVTDGNTASEALLSSAGFVQVTPAVEPAEALGYYRAAGTVRSVAPDPDVPLAVTVDEPGPVLWVIDGHRPSESVIVHDVTVSVRHLEPSSPEITELAARAMPLRGVAWLLSLRTDR